MVDLLTSLLSSLAALIDTDFFVFIGAGVLALFVGFFICSVVWGK